MAKWRINLLIAIFGVLYSVLFFNLYGVQIKKGDYYLNRSEFQQLAAGVLEAERGNIYFVDKNDNLIPAALNKDYAIVYAVPKEIQNNASGSEALIRNRVEKLSAALNLPLEETEKKLTKADDLYELLVQKVTPDQIQKIKGSDIKGVYVKNRPLRFYPFDSLAAHVLGFISPTEGNEFLGRYGLERQFNSFLRGKQGEVKQGNLIKPEKGKDIVLTIDRNIQAQAEEILSKLIKERGAAGGTIIVQDPKTGRILAMGNFPNFDPNNYSSSDIKNYLNPAVEAVYEPGSVFKVITMAAGIDSGKISPETTYLDTGSVTLDGKTIKNWDLKAHGIQTMTGVIEQSINTGAVFAQRKIGQDIFYNYLIKFGFNEPTGAALPGEVKGNINNLKSNKDIDFATASFGQGVAVTPLQLTKAISAIANNGILMKPIILKDEKPQVVRQAISSETAKKVVEMMISAVKKNELAVIKNYSVAGKTGTAFIPNFGGKGYSDELINTYVGFAPARDPKFTILIKLERPEGAPLAGQTVVPAFRELAQFVLNYYNIAPDELAAKR